MEDRIKRMESAIIASGLQGPAGLVDVKEEKEEEEEEEKTSSDRIESQAKLSNQLANLVIDSNGSSNFIGMYCFQLSALAVLTPLFRIGLWLLTFLPPWRPVDFAKSGRQG